MNILSFMKWRSINPYIYILIENKSKDNIKEYLGDTMEYWHGYNHDQK